jgi:hydrogenase maturation protein HypF
MRVAISIEGRVQGVGFRPFVYRAALRHGLVGFVRNAPDGVRIEAEGSQPGLDRFVATLETEIPSPAEVVRLAVAAIPAGSDTGFRILESAADAPVLPSIPGDLATCDACLREIRTPGERRYGYPFTNCTRCGPRYSIALGLPYDRARTSMREFEMCADCRAEYENPFDRRFHAQPIACPRCGPQLRLLTAPGPGSRGSRALHDGAAALLAGQILALKGLGGFQLVVDATDETAVRRLRERKGRDEKPFAVMFADLPTALSYCDLTGDETKTLTSPERPILLVRRRETPAVAESVAPGNPRLGAFLPCTPLHHLLLDAVGRPLVCTSGNLSEEPMVTTTAQAASKLGAICDLVLTHDRPIVRPVDDSVAQSAGGRLQVLRRARGFAPLPLPFPKAPAILATGAHLKSTIAVAHRGSVVLSQHMGDLGGPEAVDLLRRTVSDLTAFLDVRPEIVACDLHLDYASTRLAEETAQALGARLERVQHHHAHVAACMAEHGLEGEVLGFAWDGAGIGTDGALWGGEALVVSPSGFRRVAHLRPFPLPGGDRAIREGRRAALGLVHAASHAAGLDIVRTLFERDEVPVLRRMIDRGVASPSTTSVGRLFDAVAAMIGVRARSSFEGQAAMDLQFLAEEASAHRAYELPLERDAAGGAWVADWEPLLRSIVADLRAGVPGPEIAAGFHDALAKLAVTVAKRIESGRVVLSGGCFQNVLLSERCRSGLTQAGFEVHLPSKVPAGDGGISLGQALVAYHRGNGA